MNFIYTLKSYRCNKKCPYCITKILKRRAKEDWRELPEMLAKAKAEGKVFKQFVLSGNGEPANYSELILAFIAKTVEESGMFESYRVQTSGMLLFDKSKRDIFKDWYKEITITSTDFEEDSKMLKYRRDYFKIAEKLPKIRCNIVIMNDGKWYKHMLKAVDLYDTVALKILDGDNKWIKEHALPWSSSNQVNARMNMLDDSWVYDTEAKRFQWLYKNKAITMSFGKEYKHDYIPIDMVD